MLLQGLLYQGFLGQGLDPCPLSLTSNSKGIKTFLTQTQLAADDVMQCIVSS